MIFKLAVENKFFRAIEKRADAVGLVVLGGALTKQTL
jgi:hypothetical protein